MAPLRPCRVAEGAAAGAAGAHDSPLRDDSLLPGAHAPVGAADPSTQRGVRPGLLLYGPAAGKLGLKAELHAMLWGVADSLIQLDSHHVGPPQSVAHFCTQGMRLPGHSWACAVLYPPLLLPLGFVEAGWLGRGPKPRPHCKSAQLSPLLHCPTTNAHRSHLASTTLQCLRQILLLQDGNIRV
jgi:hypothetical protein